jgi:hypothetical protein
MLRFSSALVVAAGLAGGLIGCQTSSPSVQLDRPAPAMTLDREPSPAHESQTGIQQTAGSSEPRLVELNKREETAHNSRWAKLLGRFGKPKRIPLPRTDLPAEGEALVGDVDQPVIGSF